MAALSFTWNGVSSNTKHIRLQSRTPIIIPEERVEHVTIPGRDGELTLTEGNDVRNSYFQNLSLIIDDPQYIGEAERWLTGEGWITFNDTEPNIKQRARFMGAVTFTKHSHNLSYYTAEAQVYCEPAKRSTTETDITVTSSGASITNPGNKAAKPLLAITGSGAVSITIGGNTLVIPECESGWVADCENQWILDNGVPQMNAWTGAFPVIPTGTSTIAFTGSITKIVITPQWRY